jgi:hypothetical protein
VKHRRFGTNHELRRVFDFINLRPKKYLHTGGRTLGFEHIQNVICRPVAEKLSCSFLVIRDVMLFDQSDEVCGCIPCERRFYEVRICGYEMFRLAIGIGEITSAAAGNEDFFARAIGMLDHSDAASALASLHRAHKPGGPGAKNYGIELVIQGRFLCTAQLWSAERSRVTNEHPVCRYKGKTTSQPVTPLAGNLRNRLNAGAAHDFIYGADVSALRHVIGSCRRRLWRSAFVP